jgi:hypothetical protein
MEPYWNNNVTIYVCDCRRDLDWWMDLLTTYTHNLELQVITALSLSPHFTNHHSTRWDFFQTGVSLNSCSLSTASNSRDSSASRTQVLLSQPPVQNSCRLSTQLWRHLFSAYLAELSWTGCLNFLLHNHFARTEEKTPFPTITVF